MVTAYEPSAANHEPPRTDDFTGKEHRNESFLDY